MDNPIIGPIEYNVDNPDYRSGRPTEGRWNEIRRLMDTMPITLAKRSGGWVKIPMIDKKEASRASTAASTYAVRVLHAKENGWLVQTSIVPNSDHVTLFLRKVKI